MTKTHVKEDKSPLPPLSKVFKPKSGYLKDFSEERKNNAYKNFDEHFDSSENKFPAIAQAITIQSFLEKQILHTEKELKDFLFQEIDSWAKSKEFTIKSKVVELLKSEFITDSLYLFGGNTNSSIDYDFIENNQLKHEVLQFHHLIQFFNYAISEPCFINKIPKSYMEVLKSKDDLEYYRVIHDNTVALRIKHGVISIATTFHFQFESDSEWIKIDYDNYKKKYAKKRKPGAKEKDGFTQEIVDKKIKVFLESDKFNKSKFWVQSGGVLDGSIIVRELAKYIISEIINDSDNKEINIDYNGENKTIENKINANKQIQKYLPKNKRVENRRKKK